jgi:toxin ParE1/3/4
MRFEFHPLALAEYEDATRYYAGCQPGLEQRFMVAVERAIELIVAAPERWPILEADVRRCLTRVFPHVILYTVEIDHVLIIAVMHSHREPRYWRDWKPI